MQKTLKIALAAVAAPLVLAACAMPTQSSPPPRAGDWKAVTAYLKAHPGHRAAGKAAGILVTSSVDSYPCLGGTCRTWYGTVVESSGQTVQIGSDEGDDGMQGVLFPGDFFVFTPGVAVDRAADVRIIRHGAVPIR